MNLIERGETGQYSEESDSEESLAWGVAQYVSSEEDDKFMGVVFKIGSETSSETKDEISKLWMSKMLGVKDDVVERFIEGDNDACAEVGVLHSRFEIAPDGVKNFWRETKKLIPDLLAEEDLEYLIDEDSGRYAFELIMEFSLGKRENSDIAASLMYNAKVWK